MREPVVALPQLTRTDQAVLLVGLVTCRLLAGTMWPLYDDAFITFRYGHNLAQGDGLIYNPGAPWEPVLGTTSPGFAVVLAAVSLAGIPLPFAARLLGLCADVLSASFIIALLKRDRGASTIAVLSFASMPMPGGIGYFCSTATILDTAGLVWPDSRRYTSATQLVDEWKPITFS